MKSSLALVAVALGFILLIVGSLWSNFSSSNSSWTKEKADRLVKVKDRLIVLGGVVNATTPPRMHGGLDPASAKVEYDALAKENETLNAEFEAAATSPKKTSKLLRWSGIALAAIGLIGYYAIKQNS
jgi:hypothetical protein